MPFNKVQKQEIQNNISFRDTCVVKPIFKGKINTKFKLTVISQKSRWQEI